MILFFMLAFPVAGSCQIEIDDFEDLSA